MNIQEIASASALIKQELAPLSEKIGQGAEYTFELFVRQAYVDAIVNLLLIIPASLAMYFGWKWTKALIKEEVDEMIIVLTATLFIIGLSVSLANLSSLIQALLNPEYVAIDNIIKMVRGNL